MVIRSRKSNKYR